MMKLFWIAISLGFAGSLHCTGMCGSLMVYHFSSIQNNSYAIKFIIYHLMRLLAYALLGMMFGQIGFIGSLIGAQQIISILSGILLIYTALTYFFPTALKILPDINFYSIINGLFNFSSSSYYRYALSGLANGFLPCGLSFMAALFAITTYSMLHGMLFMVFFGLGTLPAMIFVSLLSQQFQLKRWKYIMPAMALITGVLLIIRSMNLGIPYISPHYELNKEKVIVQCHK